MTAEGRAGGAAGPRQAVPSPRTRTRTPSSFHRAKRALPARPQAALLGGLLLLPACSQAEPEQLLPAAGPEAIVASARDCAAAVSAERADLPLLRQRGWSETDAGRGEQDFFGMPFVALIQSGEAPLMTIAENEDGTRICSLASRLGDDLSLEEVSAAFDESFGKGTFADGFYYYYREPDMLVLTTNPRAPDSQIQVAVMEPTVRQLMEAGIIP